MQLHRCHYVGREDPLEEGMAIHSIVLAWRIPWTEEPGRLQHIGSHRVGHEWSDFTLTHLNLSRNSWSNSKFSLGVQNEAGHRLREFCQENTLVIANTLFQQHKRRLYTWTSPDGQYWNQIIIFFAAKDGEALYSQQRQDGELTVAHIMNSLFPNSDLNWRK